MGTIYKRGKTWYVDLYVSGTRIRRRVGASKKVAELALKDAEVKAARDEFGFTKNDITIDKYLERFLDYSRTNHHPSSTVRFRTVLDNFRRFLTEVHPRVGFMSQIRAEHIDQYKVYRKDAWINPNGREVASDNDVKPYTRRGARAHTVNFEIKTLTNFFNVAIKWGYLKQNPTKGIKKLKVNDAAPVRFLSEHECRRLLAASPPELYPIYFTFLNTGMRKSELENLEWDDVDFGRRKVKVRRKEHWQPKSGDREIPINAALHDLLQELKEKNEAGLNSSFVFPHKDGSRIKVNLREKMIEIAKKASIENLTKLHTLRHTFASHLVMKGVDLPTVKKLMGHADIQTTMVYAHLAPDHLAEAVDRLEF